MASNPIILEVKEKDSLGIENQTGVFETILAKPIIIEEGDQVSIKSVFIDNQQTGEQRVIIEEDIIIELEYNRYIRNVDISASKIFRNLGYIYRKGSDQLFNYLAVDGTTITDSQEPPLEDATIGWNNLVLDSGVNKPVQTIPLDFDIYVPCRFTPSHSDNGSGILTGFTLKRIITSHSKFVEEKIVLIDCSYFDVGGIKQTIRITDTFSGYVESTTESYLFEKVVNLSKEVKIGDNPSDFPITLSMTFDYDGTGNVSTKPIPSSDLPSKDWVNGIAGSIQSDTPSSSYQPLLRTSAISIPKGSYTSNDMCDIINRAMTEYSSTSGTGASIGNFDYNNNLLGFTYQDKSDGAGNATDFVKTDGSCRFNMKDDTDPQYFVGSNQFSLNYDDILNRFQFQYLHFPMYDINGNLINQLSTTKGVRGFESLGNSSISRTCGSTSGIYFDNLSARTREGGISYDFWASKLGFTQLNSGEDGDILVRPTHNKGTASTFLNDFFPSFNLTSGINITEARQDVDNLVLKGGTYDSGKGPNVVQLTTLNTKAIQSSEQNSLSVDAEVSVFRDIIDEGYYQVEVGCGISNKLVGATDIKTKISSIVNRYFSQNSYTSDAGNGSISYTHTGVPFNLSSFKIRILDSQGEVASNIGDDNTIFIEVIKKQNLN